MKKQAFLTLSLILLLSLAFAAMSPGKVDAAGNTYYVDDDYGNPYPGTGAQTDPFHGIQLGINAASAGDIVMVAAGGYTERISMKSGVEILGAGASVTIIDGGGSGSVVTANGVDSTAKLDGFTITNGSGRTVGYYNTYGGGIYLRYSSPTISNCTISGNGADYGGGIYLESSDAIISHNRITNNNASEYGGGINSYGGNPVISDNIIADNDASGRGGGIYCNYGSSDIINNLITGNGASAPAGGGVCLNRGYANIINCTISGNSGDYTNGGGVYVILPAGKTVKNCIIWDNRWPEMTGAPYVEYSCIRGGWTGGTGNIGSNPNWVTGPGGDYYLSLSPTNDCVDSGSDMASNICFTTAGGIRCMAQLTTRTDEINDTGQVDMGFHYGRNLYVPDDCATIQCAINLALTGDTIIVRPGIYVENIDFIGKAISVKSEQGPEVTTIDGGATWTVVTFDSGESSDAVLDGFTIKNGKGFTGGGIYCLNSSPTITNNIITENLASVGGGIYVGGAGSTPHITDNSIKKNTADDGGGGLSCSKTTLLTIEGNTITENSAGVCGGGIECRNAILTLRNVTISGNSAAGGGGIYAYSSTALTLENSVITFSAQGEAVLCNDPGSSATLTCCDVYGNSGGDYVESIAGQNGINGNISQDPLFCDAAGGDYSLHGNSPCATENNPGCGQIGSEPAGCDPTTYYVNCDGTGDFEWIQTALDEVPPGSIIQLEECIYTGPGNRDLDFKGKEVTLRGLISNPEDCQIDCQGSASSQYRGFHFHSNEGASSVVEGILIKNGYADDGGGILCENSSPTFNNVYFSRNQATDDGGGLACVDHASPSLSGCLFDYCEAGDDGGGLYARNWSSPMLNDCIFRWNEAADRGGGAVFVVNSFPELTNCVFYGNIGVNGGGACFVYAYGPMTDCLFYDNTASFGGGLQCYGNAQCTITRCTFSGNGASSGGGVYCRNNSSPSLINTIVAFSTQGEAVARLETNCNPTMTCCDVYGNSGGDWVGYIAAQAGINGNISEDPLFCNATYKDFTLNEDSPCAQASCGVIGAMPVGCASVVVVVPGGDITIEDAVGDVADGGTIELTDGTFTGTGNKNIDFQGKTITVRSQSGNPDACIIDCEGDGRAFYLHNSEGPDSVISGLTIKNGNASDGAGIFCNGASPTITNCKFINNTASNAGGGILVNRANPKISDCVFSGNHAVWGGGGMHNYYANPQVSGCDFDENTCEYWGGGIHNDYTNGGLNPSITDCTFTNNTSDQYGGGMYNRRSASPTVMGCTFVDNTAGLGGAGMYNRTGGSPSVTACYFFGNQATNCGGGIYNRDDSSPAVTNCMFTGNTAEQYGAGMHNRETASPTVMNCTFANNTAGIFGGAIHQTTDPTPTITNCILWGNTPDEIYGGLPVVTYSDIDQTGYGGGGNIRLAPLFTDADGPDDVMGTADDDLQLLSGSPCIDAGTSEEAPVSDLDGNPRYDDPGTEPNTGGGIYPYYDMGAYEYIPACEGDFDTDCDVDGSDLAVFAADFGRTDCAGDCEGDFDEDGDVDGSDLAVFAADFGRTDCP